MKKSLKRFLIISQVLGWSALFASACTDEQVKSATQTISSNLKTNSGEAQKKDNVNSDDSHMGMNKTESGRSTSNKKGNGVETSNATGSEHQKKEEKQEITPKGNMDDHSQVGHDQQKMDVSNKAKEDEKAKQEAEAQKQKEMEEKQKQEVAKKKEVDDMKKGMGDSSGGVTSGSEENTETPKNGPQEQQPSGPSQAIINPESTAETSQTK